MDKLQHVKTYGTATDCTMSTIVNPIHTQVKLPRVLFIRSIGSRSVSLNAAATCVHYKGLVDEQCGAKQ
jgi:hypothetical protein